MCDQSQLSYKIKHFKAFLEKCLGRRVFGYILKPLTKPGDNYRSIVLSAEVKVAETNESIESNILHLVTKTQITIPSLVDLFQPELTFLKEVQFYSHIIPAIEHFEQSSNVPDNERIDAFIRCLGTRNSLDPNAEDVDSDAVLVLENIKVLNYMNGDRCIGFDSDESLAILKQLAKFHSLCIAMRRIQPQLFNSKISPYLNAVTMIVDQNDTRILELICNELQSIDELDPELGANIQKQLRFCYNSARHTHRTTDTPYTSVVHGDLWINNIMIKRDDTGNAPIKAKIYDFQLYSYQSVAQDLILFLFTSVRPDVLTKHFKMFIKHYHTEFIKMIQLVNCPYDDYNFDKMWCEIQEKAKLELLHILFMIKVNLIDKNSAPAINDISPDTLFKEAASKEILDQWKLIINMFTVNGLI